MWVKEADFKRHLSTEGTQLCKVKINDYEFTAVATEAGWLSDTVNKDGEFRSCLPEFVWLEVNEKKIINNTL